jgi:hypothetical protein
VVHTWTEVTAERDRVVEFTRHYAFPDGQELESSSTLRFRSADELRSSLEEVGFTVEQMYGGWLREPLGAADGEIVVLARVGVGSGGSARATATVGTSAGAGATVGTSAGAGATVGTSAGAGATVGTSVGANATSATRATTGATTAVRAGARGRQARTVRTGP